MVRAEGGSLRVWGPGLLSTSPALSMSSASHSAGSSGWLAQKTGAGPTFQWAGKVDAICQSRSNRAKRPRAGCILRCHHHRHHYCRHHYYYSRDGGGGVDPIPCVSTHRISDPRSGPAQLLPPHVKQRSYPHGVRPQIPDR